MLYFKIIQSCITVASIRGLYLRNLLRSSWSLRRAVNQCAPVLCCPEIFGEIVQEEISVYFAGDKSAKDTEEIVDCRGQLYFDECWGVLLLQYKSRSLKYRGDRVFRFRAPCQFYISFKVLFMKALIFMNIAAFFYPDLDYILDCMFQFRCVLKV